MFRKVINKKSNLIIIVVIIFGFIIAFFGGLNIYKSCKIINEQVNANYVSDVNIIKKSFNNYFRVAEEETEHCSEMIKITIDNGKLRNIAPVAYKYNKHSIPYIQNYMESILSPTLLYSANHVEGLEGIYFDFDHEYIIHPDLIGLWYTRSNKDNKLKLIDNGQTSSMYPESRSDLEWFYLPKKFKKGVWSKPYTDSDLKINMISYSTPVYSAGTFLGVIGIDISMEQIKDYIYKFDQYETGKIYLINNSNRIIFAKNFKSQESTNNIDKNLYEFINKEYINSKTDINSKNIKLLKTNNNLFATVRLYNGFILAVGVANEELYGELNKLVFFTSCSLILAILISIWISLRAYRKVKKINEELLHKEKLISMGKMTAEIAHEINNPLGYISCNIDTLKKFLTKIKDFMLTCESEFKNPVIYEDDLNKKLERIENMKSDLKIGFVLDSIDEILDETKEGLKKVSEVVLNLKNFAKNHKQNVKTAENIEKIIESALTVLGNKIGNDIQIIKNFEDNPLISCNKGELEQVFINMIENALQSFDEKKITDKKITVSTYKKGKYACIEIKDNGKGIEKNNMKKIFESFYTTKTAGIGTGLGLSIAYDIIVNKHNGEILVDSKKNSGTIFIIKIPY